MLIRCCKAENMSAKSILEKRVFLGNELQRFKYDHDITG